MIQQGAPALPGRLAGCRVAGSGFPHGLRPLRRGKGALGLIKVSDVPGAVCDGPNRGLRRFRVLHGGCERLVQRAGSPGKSQGIAALSLKIALLSSRAGRLSPPARLSQRTWKDVQHHPGQNHSEHRRLFGYPRGHRIASCRLRPGGGSERTPRRPAEKGRPGDHRAGEQPIRQEPESLRTNWPSLPGPVQHSAVTTPSSLTPADARRASPGTQDHGMETSY